MCALYFEFLYLSPLLNGILLYLFCLMFVCAGISFLRNFLVPLGHDGWHRKRFAFQGIPLCSIYRAVVVILIWSRVPTWVVFSHFCMFPFLSSLSLCKIQSRKRLKLMIKELMSQNSMKTEVKWVSPSGIPTSDGVSSTAEYFRRYQECVGDRGETSETISLRNPGSFRAGEIHRHLQFWESILAGCARETETLKMDKKRGRYNCVLSTFQETV